MNSEASPPRPRLLAALAGLLLLLLSPPGSGVGAQAAERIEVNAMEYPWSAIGRVNVAGRAHCTGFLVGERRVMTAAHCLYSARAHRWRPADEIHFIAAYQREDYRLHSRVASYRRAKAFTYQKEPGVETIIADWAILTLERPVGRDAGWLGLQVLDATVLAQIARGDAVVLQAGYRRGRTQVITASLHCGIDALFADGAGIIHDCPVWRGDSGSPLLVYVDGWFRAAGIHSVALDYQDHPAAGAVAMQVFRQEGGSPDAVEALAHAGIGWAQGHLPAQDGLADPVPNRTIDSLLRRLGYLGAEATATARQQAIRRFAASSRREPVADAPSIGLLGALLQAVR